MLQEISIITAVNLLEDLLNNEISNQDIILQEAYEYGKSLTRDKKENYYVNTEFISIKQNEQINFNNVKNQLIYKQMIFGIIISFISFFIMFLGTNIVKDQETKIINKIKITRTSKITIVIGEYLNIVSSASIICIIASIINACYGGMFFKSLFMNLLILLIFVMSFSAFILFIAKIFKKVSSYIVVGSAIVLIIGIISGCFFNIDLTNSFIHNMAFLTPSYHALGQLMNYIIMNEFLDLNIYILFNLIFIFIFLNISLIIFNSKKINNF